MKHAINLNTGAIDTTTVTSALRQDYNVEAVPRLLADWNLNRYVTPTANNVPPESERAFDANIFPISSIIEPDRPTKGAAKAIIGQSIVAAKYQNQDDVHFYVGDDEDIYKYWLSPDATDANGDFPLHSDGQTTCRPYVLYPRPMVSNKIVIKLENSWATPNSFKIRTRPTVFPEGGNINTGWFQITSTVPVENNGTITLYYDGTTWSTTRPAVLMTTDVAGIMLVVDSMGPGKKRDGTTTTYLKRNIVSTAPVGELMEHPTDGASSNCAVISIEAHYEVDLTNRLETVNDTFDMSDVDQLYPVGQLTTNVGDISLSNEDGIFNNENSSSPYYKLMEPNVEFNLEYIYTVNNVRYSVQQFKMYGGPWAGQYNDSVSITLEDDSKFLKNVKPRATMYENKTIPELVWRILDSVGFVNYEIDENDLVVEHTIPVFWIDGEKTAWEILDELAKNTQTAMYFDHRGMLQVRTREAAFKDAETPVWTLYGQKSGNNLPDFTDIESSEEFEANNIDVKYRTTKWKVGSTGEPALSKVWEPEDETLVVRSTPLYTSMTTTSPKMYFKVQDIPLWPYASKVNIDGEVLSYEGKEFVYYTYTRNVDVNGIVSYTAPVKNVVVVKSHDEKNMYNDKTPVEFQSKNYLTGAVIIKERGLWNTVASNHSVDASGWATVAEYVRNDSGTRRSPAPSFVHSPHLSLVTLKNPSYLRDAADTYWVYRGGQVDTPYRVYGTRMRFRADAAHPTQRGGIAICVNGTRNDGYYIELTPTDRITTKDASVRSEIMVYSKKSGKYATVALGARMAVLRNRFYDIDVFFTNHSDGQDSIIVFVNGQKVADGRTVAATKQPASGKCAMYIRGKTVADYEYFYGTSHGNVEPLDGFGFYDLHYGGLRSGYFTREVVYQLKSRIIKVGKKNVPVTYRLNDYIFDEFGPWVHEVREFDVKFDPKPVQYSSIFNTNNWYSAVLDYLSTPFGAKFTIANVARDNAILHGEDSMVFNSAESTVNQVCTVLGRELIISDEEVVNVKNPEAIRARGQIDTELSGDWLQSKEMAEAVSQWIAKHWSEGLDMLTINVFGNPLLQVGDIVAIDYTRKNMTPATHKYFVTGTQSMFDTGIETTLTLRRVRTASPASLVSSSG